uniref:ParA family partition ATPase n=1 Tax=Pararhizobium sp. IMCC3301 TaxID=3067904 RepID=UPI00274176BE|nr:ParA family partition ATPase [Pararhizobium sp. IMCC3301]
MTGTIITIAQQKGGSGKTTLTAHMAAAALLSKKGASVALLDIDPQGSLGEWFEAREEALGEQGAGFSFRTASGWGARREARAMARDHDFVFADTPPKSDREAQPAIEAASLVLVPMQPSPVDLWATQLTLDLAAKERVPALVVVNRVPPRAKLTGEVLEVLNGYGPTVAKTMLGNRTAYAAAMGKGSSVLESGSNKLAIEEIWALFKEIQKALKE